MTLETQQENQERGPAIIVMVKAPRAGEVKTRLNPPLMANQCGQLAADFAHDTFSKIMRLGLRLLVAYTASDTVAIDALQSLLPPQVTINDCLPQRGCNLGERIENALEAAFANGFVPLVVIGTDSPTLSDDFLFQAIDALKANRADVVLGPTDDGGYYLVGVRKPFPGLFDSVAWSTNNALADTAANVARLGLRLETLPAWYDVDTPSDLLRLRDELKMYPERRERCPKTAIWLHHNLPVRPVDAATSAGNGAME